MAYRSESNYAFIFLQVSLLEVHAKIKQGYITGKEIRAELKQRFPDWNIKTGKKSDEEEVINDNAFYER